MTSLRRETALKSRDASGADDGRLVHEAVERAKAGDSEGLHFLYVRFAPDVQRFVDSLVHDHHEAEDITQNVFAKLMTKIDRYERREVPFAAWIILPFAFFYSIRGLRQAKREKDDRARLRAIWGLSLACATLLINGMFLGYYVPGLLTPVHLVATKGCAGENVNSPATMTHPTVTSTTPSMTTARRPMSSMLRHSSAVEATHTAAAIRWCVSGGMVQTNCR